MASVCQREDGVSDEEEGEKERSGGVDVPVFVTSVRPSQGPGNIRGGCK